MSKKTIISLIIFSMFSFACASTPGAGNRPDWVDDVYARYNRQQYIAAVGTGNNRQSAENNARANLVAHFGHAFEVNELTHENFQHAMASGAASAWSSSTSVDTVYAIRSGIDNLVGAEFGEAWVDPQGLHYVSITLNRARAASTYTDMARANLSMIDNLANIPSGQRNTLEGYARLQLAATIADVTVTYGRLLEQIGSPMRGIENGARLRQEANQVMRNIPVSIVVSKDPEVDLAGRIQGAFARAISELGFLSGGTNSPYILDVNIILSPTAVGNLPGARIEVGANLMDTRTQVVLFPFNFNTREGHTNQSEANNRVILAAERRINNEYVNLLNNYLSRMLPDN